MTPYKGLVAPTLIYRSCLYLSIHNKQTTKERIKSKIGNICDSGDTAYTPPRLTTRVPKRHTTGWLIKLLTFFAQRIRLNHSRWFKAEVRIVETLS
jgi:hypothetical protein